MSDCSHGYSSPQWCPKCNVSVYVGIARQRQVKRKVKIKRKSDSADVVDTPVLASVGMPSAEDVIGEADTVAVTTNMKSPYDWLYSAWSSMALRDSEFEHTFDAAIKKSVLTSIVLFRDRVVAKSVDQALSNVMLFYGSTDVNRLLSDDFRNFGLPHFGDVEDNDLVLKTGNKHVVMPSKLTGAKICTVFPAKYNQPCSSCNGMDNLWLARVELDNKPMYTCTRCAMLLCVHQLSIGVVPFVHSVPSQAAKAFAIMAAVWKWPVPGVSVSSTFGYDYMHGYANSRRSR